LELDIVHDQLAGWTSWSVSSASERSATACRPSPGSLPRNCRISHSVSILCWSRYMVWLINRIRHHFSYSSCTRLKLKSGFWSTCKKGGFRIRLELSRDHYYDPC